MPEVRGLKINKGGEFTRYKSNKTSSYGGKTNGYCRIQKANTIRFQVELLNHSDKHPSYRFL